MSPISNSLMALAVLAAPALAQYSLVDTYDTSNFFDQFQFFDTNQQQDPTSGFVHYLNRDDAQNAGLIATDNNHVTMRVDSTNSDPTGRASVRVQSTKSYQHGLFILDLNHMPFGCGVWPAYWLLGPNWPYTGEIDIIEGVHKQGSDLSTLHTDAGCSRADPGGYTGTAGSTASCERQPGCGIDFNNGNTYGEGFNGNGGGVYATEWNSDAISAWFWTHDAVPGDVSGGTPDPSTWGAPTVQFYKSACNIDQYFQNQQIIFNTELCGDWAGQADVWNNSGCANGDTCQSFVQNNPGSFTDAYWEINNLKVYANGGASAQTASLPKEGAFKFNVEVEHKSEL